MIEDGRTRREFMKWTGSAAAVVLGTRLLRAAEPSGVSRPNILFIMADEMRWNAMGCAGHANVRTPNLDRLARESTRFAAAYTCAPVCVPSRYSFFTSRYAHVHGSTDNGTPPQPGQVLLPVLLRHYGYETAISGKLHFLPPDQEYGFDSFWSFSNEGPGKLQSWPQYVEAKHGRGSARRLVPGSQPFPDDPLGKDLGKDPGEDVNLIDYLACASLSTELKARLEAWQRDCPPPPVMEGLSVVDSGRSVRNGPNQGETTGASSMKRVRAGRRVQPSVP